MPCAVRSESDGILRIRDADESRMRAVGRRVQEMTSSWWPAETVVPG